MCRVVLEWQGCYLKGTVGVEGLWREAMRRNKSERETQETERNVSVYFPRVLSFPRIEAKNKQHARSKQSKNRLQDIGNILYKPVFHAFFPQLWVLLKKKKGKSSEILMVLAFDKQEADKHGAKFIFN